MKVYSIYYPEYNIENVIDFINSKRRVKSSRKRKKFLTSMEILTSPLSPIQKHQNERKKKSVIDSDLRVYTFKGTSFKKSQTFLAEN